MAAVAGTQFLYATRERRDRFLSNGDQIGPTEFNLWSPKVGLLWDIDPTWQVFANVSRSAEVPSFGESVAIMHAGIPTFRSPASNRSARRPMRSARAAAGRISPGSSRSIAPRSRTNCCASTARSAIAMSPMPTAPCIRASRSGTGAAIFKSMFVRGDRPDKLWLNVAYTFNDFRFDNDPMFGNNLLPGAPRHFVRAEAAL